MSIRILQYVVGLCLTAGGIAFALEPVRTETSMAELVLKMGRGQVSIPTRDGRIRPEKTLTPKGSTDSSRTDVSSRRVLPPVPGLGGELNGAAPGPANQSGHSLRSPDLPELRSLPGNAPVKKAAKAMPSLPHPLTGGKAATLRLPRVNAKAMYCVDYTSNRVVLAENISEPLPIASITKLLTAMTAIDEMNLNRVLTVPHDIRKVPRHRVGLRPGDRLTVKDALHGMLIESGNDCAEVIAQAYPKGGRKGFLEAMARKARRIGATSAKVYTPSGLDRLLILGRKESRELPARKPNTASAKDVAVIAHHAFQYPLIRSITSMKNYTMRTLNAGPRNYNLTTNDKLLSRKLPVAGAKTGYTNLAGRCIVALFKDRDKEHMVVVLNTPRHFKAAENIYRWACKTF
ncbi:MAG: serine hydrolase [Pseudomonadota bacterium]